MPSVLDSEKSTGLCCGCGVCAGLCPFNSLVLQWNQAGEYQPVFISDCKNCGICLSVCPFENNNPNEDDIGQDLFSIIPSIHHRKETGYYLQSYVGHMISDEDRWNSASGGLATWFLTELMKRDIVDKVICVRKSSSPDKLYEFFVAETIEDVKSASGSAYYPTEMSGVLKEILQNHKRYAVIALPCFVKALRLAQRKSKHLSERIVCIASLTCGHMKSTEFTKHIAEMSGLNEDIQSVHYRTKSLERPANLFSFDYVGVEGNTASRIWNEGIGGLWASDEYTVPACNFCDDIFGECADVTFMDAWLPEYISDPRGTSLCIVRSELAESIFQNSNAISISPISIDKIIQSQRGVIQNKREMLSYRLANLNNNAPNKRVKPVPFHGIFLICWIKVRKIVGFIFSKFLRFKIYIQFAINHLLR